MSSKFKTGDSVFAPMMGIGLIEDRRKITAGGLEVEVFELSFNRESLRIKSWSANRQSVPVAKADVRLFKIASNDDFLKAFKVIAKSSKRPAMMWAKRSDGYRNALKSGDLIEIAEVYRESRKDGVDDEALSYSEKEIRDEALAALSVQLAYQFKIERGLSDRFLIQVANGDITFDEAALALKENKIVLKESALITEVKVSAPQTEAKDVNTVPSPREKRNYGGRRASPIALGIETHLIDFINIAGAQEKLDVAYRAFAGQPNLLVLWAIDNLYKQEIKAEKIKEYIEQRNIQPQSLVSEKSRANKIFNIRAEVEMPLIEKRPPPLATQFTNTTLQVSSPKDVKPNASALATPLHIVLKMRLIDEETFFTLKVSKKPPETLGDIFQHVANDSWPDKASRSFGLDETRAERVKTVLTKAARDLSLIVK